MKKLVTLVIAIALVLSLGTLAAAEGPVKAYAVTVMSGGAAWGRFEEGFMEACEELGWEGHYLAPSTANDYTAMVQLTETALNDGADVLAVCVSDTGLFQEVLQRAKDAGVTLIGAGAGLEGYTSALVGTDAAQLGANTADTLVKLMGDKPIHVAAGQSLLANEMQNIQVQAFIDRLAEIRPDAVVVDRFENNSVASTAADKLSALYIANPELNAVVSFDSYVGIGAASFISDYGIEDDFYGLGIDDGAEVLLCIKNGTLDATIAQQWYEIGKQCVKVAEQVRNGEEVEYNQGIPTIAILPEDVDAHAAEAGISLE
ncbi:MAG: sugar ABC transporter substrate-binding protein [Christensenellales bacterium]